MSAPKKYTQFIFDDLDDPQRAEPYGYLGLCLKVCKNLIDARWKKRLTQHDLAKKSGIAQPTIAKIESGRGNPTLMQLVKIAHALGYKIALEPAEFGPGDFEGYME